MNNLKMIAPVLLVLLVGCAKPGLRGVIPTVGEYGEAQRQIRGTSLPPPRNLPRDQWHPTLNRVIGKIGPAAYRTCLDVGALNCEQVKNSVFIVDDDRINAFVDEEHKVSVHTGLLYYAASDEEIAAVLAHEYGHIFADHIRKTQANAGAGFLAGALAGLAVTAMTGVNVTEEGMETGQSLGGFAYSQAFELESDYYSGLILEKAGIDLRHGQNLLIRLARTSQGSTGMWGKNAKLMAITHPANDQRIARWLGARNAIQASKHIKRDHSQAYYVYENQLRKEARDRLMGGSLVKRSMTRWVNPQTGHSGMFQIGDLEYKKECSRDFVRVDQVDHVQGKSGKSKHWFLRNGFAWEPMESASCKAKRTFDLLGNAAYQQFDPDNLDPLSISSEEPAVEISRSPKKQTEKNPGFSTELLDEPKQKLDSADSPAYVYFFRPLRDGNARTEPPVMFTSKNNQRITHLASLDNGRFFTVALEPGIYSFFSNERNHPVRLTLYPGKKKYIEMDSSKWSNRAKLLWVKKEEIALEEISHLQPLDRKYVEDPRVVVPKSHP